MLSAVNLDTLYKFLVIGGTYKRSCRFKLFGFDEPKEIILSFSPLPINNEFLLLFSFHMIAMNALGVLIVIR